MLYSLLLLRALLLCDYHLLDDIAAGEVSSTVTVLMMAFSQTSVQLTCERINMIWVLLQTDGVGGSQGRGDDSFLNL